MLFGENTFRQLFAGHVVGFRPTKRHEKMHRMMRLIVATYVLGTFVSSEPQGLQCNRQWSFIVFSCLDVTFPVTNIIQTQYCFYFQIDNQQIGTVFPVALYPSPLPKAVIQKSGTCRFFFIQLWSVEWSAGVMKCVWDYLARLWSGIASCWIIINSSCWQSLTQRQTFWFIPNFLCNSRLQQAIKSCLGFSQFYYIETQTSIWSLFLLIKWNGNFLLSL